MTNALLEILAPVQKEFDSNPEWQELTLKAYPPPEVKKKVKKPKNLGTRFPGAQEKVESKPDGHVEGEMKAQVDLSTGADEALENMNTKLS